MRVEREGLKQSILTVLADMEMTKILSCSAFQLKSVTDIIRETGMPHTSAYRKINSLLQMGLLFVEKIEITPDGKKFSLFRSTIREIDIKYDGEKVMVDVEYNTDVPAKTAARFYSISED